MILSCYNLRVQTLHAPGYRFDPLACTYIHTYILNIHTYTCTLDVDSFEGKRKKRTKKENHDIRRYFRRCSLCGSVQFGIYIKLGIVDISITVYANYFVVVGVGRSKLHVRGSICRLLLAGSGAGGG